MSPPAPRRIKLSNTTAARESLCRNYCANRAAQHLEMKIFPSILRRSTGNEKFSTYFAAS